MPSAMTLGPKGYDNFLAVLKDRIKHAKATRNAFNSFKEVTHK